MRRFLAAAALVVCAAVFAGAAGQIIGLGCMEALVAADHADLAGVFSFVPEKDAPAAFADLIIHDRKARDKYLAKIEKDFKAASAVSIWDHEALQFALTIYASPLAETLDKPSTKTMARINDLVRAPALTLEQMNARRRR